MDIRSFFSGNSSKTINKTKLVKESADEKKPICSKELNQNERSSKPEIGTSKNILENKFDKFKNKKLPKDEPMLANDKLKQFNNCKNGQISDEMVKKSTKLENRNENKGDKSSIKTNKSIQEKAEKKISNSNTERKISKIIISSDEETNFVKTKEVSKITEVIKNNSNKTDNNIIEISKPVKIKKNDSRENSVEHKNLDKINVKKAIDKKKNDFKDEVVDDQINKDKSNVEIKNVKVKTSNVKGNSLVDSNKVSAKVSKNSCKSKTSDDDDDCFESNKFKPKIKRKIESESEDEAMCYEVSDDEKHKSSIKKKIIKKRKTLSSDSDEDPLPKKLRPMSRSPKKKDSKQFQIKAAFEKAVKNSHLNNYHNEGSSKMNNAHFSPKKSKTINAEDFFGCSLIHRSELPICNVNKVSQPCTEAIKTVTDKDAKTKTISGKLSKLKEQGKHLESPISPDFQKSEIQNNGKIYTKIQSDRIQPEKSETELYESLPCADIEMENSELINNNEKSDKSNEKNRRLSYLAYKNREPPKALGSKEIPEGKENCMEGLTFVLTGIYESMERDEVKSLIEQYGGKVTTNVSKNTKYLVVGRDAGATKLAKAEQLKTKQIDEDGVLELIKTLPGKKSKYLIAAEKEHKEASRITVEINKPSSQKTKVDNVTNNANIKFNKTEKILTPQHSTNTFSKTLHDSQNGSSFSSTLNSVGFNNSSQMSSFSQVNNQNFYPPSKTNNSKTSLSLADSQLTDSPQAWCDDNENSTGNRVGPSMLWVDKYKPTNLKQIVGQQGDKSQAKKLLNWLLHWVEYSKKKPVFGRTSEDGVGYKAALLSGPPGVGKTTTAQLVCKEAKFSYFELNASDTRSKKSLEGGISECLNNHTLIDYMGASKRPKLKASEQGHRHCLIMDEVDGMAGNEDRGGVQELIQLIKKTQIPIICMCNDRNHPKIRSLSNYCFDLRFQRPRLEQIKASIMSIAFKEGLKIPAPALNDVILAANQDIRQVIHNLSMWTAREKGLTIEQAKKDSSAAQKDLHLTPFDVCRKVFSGGSDTSKMTLVDKSDLFFHDYSIAPLFVHENYPLVTPFIARGNIVKHLSCLSRAAHSISIGDRVDLQLRRGQNWSLLPTQAIFASVIPGECMRGVMGGMIQFPSWLGRNSTTGKNERLVQELAFHSCLNISGSKRSLILDYLPHFRNFLTLPLIKEGTEGIDRVVNLLNSYDLIREDFDSVLDLTTWNNSTSGGSTKENDLMSKVETKVKAAFTRAFNKESHLTPYSMGAVKKGNKRKGAAISEVTSDDELAWDQNDGEEEKNENGEEINNDDDDNIELDAMIKKQTKKMSNKAPGKTAAVPSTSKVPKNNLTKTNKKK